MLLTNTECKNARYEKGAQDKLRDGGGLYLHLMPSGAKIWRHRIWFSSKENTLTYGPYPLVSLLEAREKREASKKMLLSGVDPSQVKKSEKMMAALNAATTFEAVAREWHETTKVHWSASYAMDTINRLERDIFPKMGSRPIADILTPEFLGVLRLIEKRGAHEVARRMLALCGQIFRYAVVTGRSRYNPSVDLRGIFRPHKREHFAAIETKEIPEFLQALGRNDSRLFVQTRHAVKMLMLTFVRTNELIKAKWDEIDFDEAEWIIPEERMKMRRPHIVPLARQTLAILREMKELNGNREYIFASQAHPRQHMSNNTILGALGRMGYKSRMTGHGFRALAMSTIKEKLGYRHEVVDRQLAHAPANKVDAAYDRAMFLSERRRMMQEWADYLDKASAPGKVVHVDFAHASGY